MRWFSRRAPEPERVAPQVKSFLMGGLNSVFTDTEKSAFELLMGRGGIVNYDQCPPLAISLNRIIRALSGLDLHYYSGSEIVASRADVLIKTYQNHRDLSELIKSIQCAGKGYCVLVGNADFMPSKIATIRPADVSEFTDQHDNTYRLLINGGRWAGTYEQIEYGGDVYRTGDKLRTIILIHNQISPAPLSPISAAMKTIIEGYNQNYRTIKNGGRLNSVWAFKDALDEPETAARRLQANARVQQGGVTVTSGGDLDIKEFGLSAKDMDWANQLHRCDV
ncbi:MAG: hypothetical protein ACEQSD_10955, partial [Flavobacteriales bacterium]